MNKKKALSVVLMASGISLGGVAAIADIASPTMLANTCAACHGPNGSSIGIMPSLAGTPTDYFIETMNGFKDGSRKATVMDRIAKGYSEGEIRSMATYFSKQKPVPQKQAFDAKKAEAGRKLHADHCEKCHEDGGRAPDEAAVLAGQSMLYLQYAMEDFKEKHREAPMRMSRQVRKVLDAQGPAGIEALLHYYASQQN